MTSAASKIPSYQVYLVADTEHAMPGIWVQVHGSIPYCSYYTHRHSNRVGAKNFKDSRGQTVRLSTKEHLNQYEKRYCWVCMIAMRVMVMPMPMTVQVHNTCPLCEHLNSKTTSIYVHVYRSVLECEGERLSKNADSGVARVRIMILSCWTKEDWTECTSTIVGS